MAQIREYDDKNKTLKVIDVNYDDRNLQCKCDEKNKVHQFALNTIECVCGKFNLRKLPK